MVRILVLSFLFQGESFSFVRCLWLLDLINRKIFFVDILWICFASSVLWWWLENLLLPSIQNIVWDLCLFSGSLSCLQEGVFSWSVFAGGPQLACIVFILYQGVFISFIVIYDYILLLFYRSFFSFMIQKIWYCCVEAWKIVGNNSKGFSQVNVPN